VAVRAAHFETAMTGGLGTATGFRATNSTAGAGHELIRLHVVATDPLSRAGLASQLRGHPELEMVDGPRIDAETVGLVVADDVDEDVLRTVRSLRRQGMERVMLVLTRVDDQSLLAALEAGVSGLLRRQEVSAANLISAIRATAAGDGTLPPDLLGRLLDQVGRLQRQVLAPRGLSFGGLTEREVKVLRLLADGNDTAEVGRRLFYSERTVKNIIHDVTSRLDLRNRTHAVAYALRQGLI
jgi:DNA-binding NarL/FixJ family response regulator